MNVENYIGIPYVSMGRTLDGFDCWGLILHAAQNLYSTTLPDYSDYRDSDNMKETSPLFTAREDWIRVPKGAELPGDVIVMRLHGLPMHAALYLGEGRFLHTLTGRDSCVERVSSSGWSTRIEGVYRWQQH